MTTLFYSQRSNYHRVSAYKANTEKYWEYFRTSLTEAKANVFLLFNFPWCSFTSLSHTRWTTLYVPPEHTHHIHTTYTQYTERFKCGWAGLRANGSLRLSTSTSTNYYWSDRGITLHNKRRPVRKHVSACMCVFSLVLSNAVSNYIWLEHTHWITKHTKLHKTLASI